MNLDRKVMICFNEPTRYYNNYLGKEISEGTENIDLSESEFLKQIDNIKRVLSKQFISVETLAVNNDIRYAIKKITNYSPDVILNFVESIEGVSNLESFIAGVFDLMAVPYTGNNPICLGNCLIKSRTKQILNSHGIKTPSYFIAKLNHYPTPKELLLRYPAILKLVREDASIGISEFSVVNNHNNLKERLNYLFSSYNP